MESSLLDRFFAEEYDDYVRQQLLEELGSRSQGLSRFEFNVFNVLLDFDSGMVTIEDVLEPDPDESIPLADFGTRLRRAGPGGLSTSV